MKFSNKVTAAAVLVFISVFSISTFFSSHNKAADVRSSARLTRMSWSSLSDGSYFSSLSEYTAKKFSGRGDWIAAGALIKTEMCESVVNGVYISQERLLSAEIPSYGSFEENAALINNFAEKYDGAVYAAAIPTSAGVYGDILPSYLQQVTEKQQIDRFYDLLDTDIRRIDAYSILKTLSDNYIYYRSDSKWTSYGAYCVYRTVIQKLGFLPASYDKYTVHHITDNYKGDLYKRSQYMESNSDLLDIYEYSGGAEITGCTAYDNAGKCYEWELYDIDAAGSDDKYRLYLGEKMPFVKITANVNNEKRLLVIGDDFAACFIPFLTQHYSEIVFVSPECMELRLKDHIDIRDYEQTLFLFGIDSLSSKIKEF